MNLTKADAARLGRQRLQPVKAKDELLAIFCPGRLVNPLNASAWGWQKRSRLAKQWKERVAMALLEAGWRVQIPSPYSRRPKHVHFHAHTWNALDDDGLSASLKPCRDALVECGVISGDAMRDGHVFTYSQEINRAQRGVVIGVSLRRPDAENDGG